MTTTRRRSALFWYLPVVLITLAFAFPIVWMLMTSVKTLSDTFALPPKFVFTPTFENYQAVWENQDFRRSLVNSIVIVLASTAFSIVLGCLTAYGFSRYRIPGGNNILFWILSLRMLPAIAVIVPYFLLFSALRMLDKHLTLILVYSIFNISFSVWLLKGFFDEIPREMEEAAMMDGFGPWAVFRRVSLPLVVPGIVTVAVFNIIQSINEFLLAFVLTSRAATTGPVALAKFQTGVGVNWGQISAAASMLVLPVIIFTILVRRHLIRGMSFGRLR